jgi:hypothetical protein
MWTLPHQIPSTLKPPQYHDRGNPTAHDIKDICNINMDAWY